jgi:hypothetical protein
MVTHKTYKKDIQPFILNQIKDFRNKNSDNGESNHRIIAASNLHCFLYDVSKPIGGKQGMKNIVFDMVNNSFIIPNQSKEWKKRRKRMYKIILC